MPPVRACVSEKIKQIPFSCRMAKGFTFLKRVQNQFKMLLEVCIVLASIVPTEKNAIYLTLCNISEIHLWLWKVLSLVVCSKSPFYVTRARKDDKNRQNAVFLLKRGELGGEQAIVT